MPRLNNDDMNFNDVGTYGFSGTRIDDLGATEYCLATIVVDASGSVQPFEKDMEKTLKEAIRACQLSPRADNLMIRVIKFNEDFEEIHGFKLLEKINLDDYNNILQCKGRTLLYESVVNSLEATISYAKTLVDNDFKCNAINIVITDGEDNKSSLGKKSVAEKMNLAVTSEALESIVSILVGVNVGDKLVSNYLNELHKEAYFTQYVELTDANSKTLAKLANFVSKSISAQSQSLGTGGPSQSLSF